MMETKKEEAIRKAYGEYWETYKDLIDDNGWFANRFTGNDIPNKKLDFRTEKEDKQHPFRFRIKGLQGVETNNGWIRIESDEDFPEPGQYWVIDDDGDMFITDMEFFEDMFDWSVIRYYQPIVKPKPPIY